VVLIEAAPIPTPTLILGVVLPYAAVVPHSNQALAAAPLGLTEPFRIAVVLDGVLAEKVVTWGGRVYQLSVKP
jgi:hypothetical protein